ncbi:DUF6491 family protein [Rhodanobacter denitrificans]|uniref:Uncharacterized protein n=1 Tax=Rhodanobacter denitrificans TaxID=666685 RepID=I4WW89_9GAMM|nr:DUF6491 family protein [Rhodanobacter denitrificans]AGG90537.1 hypothetical protein R2APBS1_3474 [Rhodanobacter denitrificans]EIM03731.1 hypothetical protein UUC_06567 [Rhodanobacter denitrificans]UJJ57188.1 DUF6491 family protein [Rhodanobacter denitrificans]UJM85920.1 DUF6491 family protein [Rhodanobacter denitrificans]UJM91048.1 DUF6491 family protein [Rhodanobacter denitrificans]
MSQSPLIPAGALLLGLLCAGCSSVPYAQRMSERQAAYAAAAGAPVRSFRFFSLYSWEPLGDTQLAVYTQPNKAWLLDLGGCQELRFVNSIGLTSNLNQVMVGFDKVLTGRHNFPCTITQIRPVEVKSLKLAQQQQRQIESAAREGQPPAAAH